MNTLQNKIMRRIYYAYALRLVLHPAVTHGFSLLTLLIVLTYFVSLGDVLNNLMTVKVGHLGVYFYNAITNTEAWTLLIIGGFIYSAFSLRVRVAPKKRTYKFV